MLCADSIVKVFQYDDGATAAWSAGDDGERRVHARGFCHQKEGNAWRKRVKRSSVFATHRYTPNTHRHSLIYIGIYVEMNVTIIKIVSLNIRYLSLTFSEGEILGWSLYPPRRVCA